MPRKSAPRETSADPPRPGDTRMPLDVIRVRGAAQNNLQDVDADFPLGAITAVTGVSGSGKSSLAFDTLYAEGQRRYVESFSPYARQFMQRMDRPRVRRVEGVLPAVAIDQKNTIRASRSTVGTVTELTDFIKLLFARAALLRCGGCGEPVHSDEPGQAAGQLLAAHGGRRAVLAAELEESDPRQALERLASHGHRRLWVRGEVLELPPEGDTSGLPAGEPLTVLVDRLRLEPDRRPRLAESLESAMHLGGGRARVDLEREPGAFDTLYFSQGRHCARCDVRYPAPTPNLFSYNSPLGACPTCNGFGAVIDTDLELVIPDPRKSLRQGAVRPWSTEGTAAERRELRAYCRAAGIPEDVPWAELSPWQREGLVEGDEQRGWFGVRGWFRWQEHRTYKMHVRVLLSRYRAYTPCPDCQGSRLRPEPLMYSLQDRTLAQLYSMTIAGAREFFDDLELPPGDAEAMAPVLREIRSRLRYLCQSGVGYLTLDRQSRTLSGGEVQRVNLTTAIGSALVNTLYVLDEPSVGLHPRDNERLLEILERLRANRNTIVLVEHDEAIIRRCDHIVDLGPGPGAAGGQVVFEGPPARLCEASGRSATARHLCGGGDQPAASGRGRKVDLQGRALRVRGARQNNLQGVDLALPLDALTVVTGVSGSGKSTLVQDVLYRGLMRQRGKPVDRPGAHDAIVGGDALQQVVLVDQSPVGTTPRSNPATYVKAFDAIRKLFAGQQQARLRGLGPGSFSFNVPGGRCDACEGNGFERVEMQFLADCYVTCEKCGGRRFKDDVLAVQLQGRSIHQVLQMTIHEAAAFFGDSKEVQRGLAALARVGLGYLTLGQPLNTLSGGESQRLKLAGHLALHQTRDTLFLLDEPTTGLHPVDVATLIANLQQLVDQGNTVLVIEHHLDVIAAADWIVDLGPGGGDEGGQVVVSGAPEHVARCREGHTGRYLAKHLARQHQAAGAAGEPTPVKATPRALAPEEMEVQGARVHNLRDLSLRIPRDRLVVVTGPSGSGKSSLVFDVLFAEGQRRFVDCLSPYARQYIAQLGRPDVDQLLGVPPTVLVSQLTTRGGRKSTVATITEVYHYLRLMFARVGTQHCNRCGQQVGGLAADDLVQQILDRHRGQRVRLLAPAVRGRKGYHQEVFQRAAARGQTEVRVDGRLQKLDPGQRLERYQEHDIELVVGRLEVGPRRRAALERMVQEALELGGGTLYVLPPRSRQPAKLCLDLYCAACAVGFDPPDPRSFSFNSRAGACPVCEGTGVDPTLPDGVDQRRPEPPCPACGGARLHAVARAVRVGDRSIHQLTALTPGALAAFFEGLSLAGNAATIAAPAISEIVERCRFLVQVGLDYLSLDRGAHTLSGGEAQRVRLAAQLSANLRGVLYVLDEPTIGLHPRDNQRLLGALRRLVDCGNTVVVVEHDDDTIRAADHIVDMGPGGGSRGGQVVAAGPAPEVLASPDSLTARCLLQPGHQRCQHRGRPLERDTPRLTIEGARHHNLQDLAVEIPAGRLTVVTGVSGSGKSSLVRDVLGQSLRRLARGGQALGCRLNGAELFRRVREIDQSPVGKTPASTPATYVGLWDHIRRLFAGLPEARVRGYKPGRFSFNVKGGRCEHCRGQGQVKHEMSFLPEVHVRCEHCGGRRFNAETLRVRYRGRSIAGVLEATVSEARKLLAAQPAARRTLDLLQDVGLDYLKLGQPSNTLSGGEAQRIKLVEELQKEGGQGALYIMDEPSTGLHPGDLRLLLGVLQRLVDRGDTVVVIEHNLDLIASADWLIDLGPGGGQQGGRLVYQGPRDGLLRATGSATAGYLRRYLG